MTKTRKEGHARQNGLRRPCAWPKPGALQEDASVPAQASRGKLERGAGPRDPSTRVGQGQGIDSILRGMGNWLRTSELCFSLG